MNWITDLIKQLEISFVIALAALISTSVILFGPELGLTFIKPAPSNTHWFLTLICLFSASIVAVRTLQLLRHLPLAQRKLVNRYNQILTVHPLSANDKKLLSLITITAPNGSCDLRNLTNHELEFLDFLKSRDSLQKRGLITVLFDDNYVCLTTRGRELGHTEILKITNEQH